MSNKQYMKRCEQERAEANAARRAREDACDAAVAANPELYKTLKQAARDARDAFKEADAAYKKVERAQEAARKLKYALEDSDIDAREYMYSVTLLASIDKRLQPLIERRNAAIEPLEAAERALNEHFPDDYRA